ncbi:DUF6894 family protein [Microvirga sp. G4-2]|uniref:DUF6894 family protein n=1 Tax=Microvirga sp. G4-2 TaxID=3434467 RepID=UPI004043F12A
MTNAPRRSSQRQDLKRWESEGGAPRSGRRFHDPNPAPLPKAEPALYYFNIRTESGVIEDPEGNVCPDLQSAREKALIDASDIILKGDRLGEDRRGWCFEIMDRANQHVSAVPFSEAPNRRN